MTQTSATQCKALFGTNGFEQADCGSSARCQRAAVFLEGLRDSPRPTKWFLTNHFPWLTVAEELPTRVLFSIWRTEMNGVSGSQLPSGSKC